MRGLSTCQHLMLNAKLKLHSIREWLGRLRGEVDAGIVRLDAVLSNLKESEPGQGSREMGRILKPKRKFKPKQKHWVRKKRRLCNTMGESSGCGPNEVEVSQDPQKPKMVENLIEREVACKEQLGTMVVIGCLDSFRRNLALDSNSKTKPGDFRRVIEELGASGLLSSASEEIYRMSGGISGGSGHSVEALGLIEEEGGMSFVEESVERLLPTVGTRDDAMMALERKQGEIGVFIEGSKGP